MEITGEGKSYVAKRTTAQKNADREQSRQPWNDAVGDDGATLENIVFTVENNSKTAQCVKYPFF
jgi:hypothetical protein